MADDPKPQLARFADAIKDQPEPPTAAEMAAESKTPQKGDPVPDDASAADMKQNNAQANDGIDDREERLVRVGRGHHTTGRL